MENLQYSKIFKKNWELVALIVGVAVVLALIVSLLQPFQYAANTKILIIQKQDKNLDAYTATKSAERIGKNLVNVLYTSSFYNEVIESSEDISNHFPADGQERRKAWKKNVKADVIPETGILEINVYDMDKAYATQLVKAISYVLVSKGSDYHGGGTDVEIKIVDDVLLSKYPVRPNIALNAVLALVIGFLIGSACIILAEAKHNKSRAKYSAKVAQAAYFEEVKKHKQSKNSYQRVQITEAENKPINPAKGLLSKVAPVVIKSMYDHLS
jgi:capsular polysaccharide biosynthesis protein